MSSSIMTALLWAFVLSSGLMAGVYFAFSGFIMKAFDELEASQSISAMNAMNEIILRSIFMPVFFGSSILSLLVVVLSFVYWGQAGTALAFIAGMLYFIGMFICTAAFNVPLNNALASVSRDTRNVQQAWSHYLKNWTRWNHLRTVSSMLSCILCIWLLMHHF